MISFVCWKWTDPRLARRFTSEHVNVLARQIRKHYCDPHRFVCVTDDPHGLDSKIVYVPMPRTGFEDLVNPSDKLDAEIAKRRRGFRRVRHVPAKVYPSCYRRLWNFSREAATALGSRIFALDIDVIVMGDLRPLANRNADFVGWCDHRFERGKIAGGAYLLTTGSHPEVWEDFRAEESVRTAVRAGHRGSDQGWMSLKLFPPKQVWSNGDGLAKINWLARHERPPAEVRLVFTNGAAPPWDEQTRRDYPWVKEYWQ